MGQAATLLVAAGALALSMIVFAMQRDTFDADERLYVHTNTEVAREAALAGLQVTVRKLAEDPLKGSWTDGNKYYRKDSYRGGSYEIDVRVTDPCPEEKPDCIGDMVDVIARGMSGGEERVIYARYTRDMSNAGIPPSFKYGIIAEKDISLKGTADINSLPGHNVMIHSNGTLSVSGAARVYGFGTYSGAKMKDSDEKNLENYFIPTSPYVPEERVTHVDRIEIATLDWDQLKAIVGGPYKGNFTFGGGPPREINGIDLLQGVQGFIGSGTKENPYIFVVDGSIEFFNPTRFNGYAIIAATGGISINHGRGDVLADLTTDDPPQTKLLLASKDGSFTAGNAQINATIYTEGGVKLSGTMDITGGIIAQGGDLELSGTPQVTYATPAEAIVTPGFESVIPIGPILIAYSEF